jgi:hypothetical protein
MIEKRICGFSRSRQELIFLLFLLAHDAALSGAGFWILFLKNYIENNGKTFPLPWREGINLDFSRLGGICGGETYHGKTVSYFVLRFLIFFSAIHGLEVKHEKAFTTLAIHRVSFGLAISFRTAGQRRLP